jgi:hypothetical protein
VREVFGLSADLTEMLLIHRGLRSLLSYGEDVRHMDGRFVLVAVLADQFMARGSNASTSYSRREPLGREGNYDHGSTKVLIDRSKRAEVTFWRRKT